MKNLSYTLSCIKKDVYTFLFSFILFILCVIPFWDSATNHSPSGKELNPSSLEMLVFQGVADRETNFTLSCVIPLRDSATAQSPSGEKHNPSSQEDARFSVRYTSGYNFYFILCHPSLGLSNSSLTLR